ncbi:MAG: hypothetical protein HYW26_03200 [Candidatus Aenigmarchaeota archaeon]|nr:hypothetical protein [Candidatus Aenigmarchaeota archaeon]
MMKLNKETTLASTLFFLGVSALSLFLLSVYQSLTFPFGNETVTGFLSVLYIASTLLTGVFSLLAFWHHVKRK